VSEVSEAEVREWLEEEEQGAGGKEPGAADRQPVLTRWTSWRPQERGRRFHLSPVSLVRITSFWDRPGRRAKGELATCRHRADSGQETDCTQPRYDIDRSRASND